MDLAGKHEIQKVSERATAELPNIVSLHLRRRNCAGLVLQFCSVYAIIT